MNILLSLPQRAAREFAMQPPFCIPECQTYYDADPQDARLGSGGGTVWILDRFRSRHPESEGKTIVVHAGGESRRLPAYAAMGKSMIPVPVMRWAEGEKIDQTLLDLQLPGLRSLLEKSPKRLGVLVASGDALVTLPAKMPEVPDADVVCLGIWEEDELARNHGVFFLPRASGGDSARLDFMLQKPTLETLADLKRSHYCLMDAGVWLLSERAVDKLRLLSQRAKRAGRPYDLYSDFGCGLGMNPSKADDATAELSVAIIPVTEGKFYHFGTTRQLLSSTLSLQNIVADQRRILFSFTKPSQSLFVQNSLLEMKLTSANSNIWIENCELGKGWTLSTCNMLTGIPANDWTIHLHAGQCVDMIPVGKDAWALRPYGFDDAMRGDCGDEATRLLGCTFEEWLRVRDLDNTFVGTDIQCAHIYPVASDLDSLQIMLRWMLSEPQLEEGKRLWIESEKLSAHEIMDCVNIERLESQRRSLLRKDLQLLSSNPQSVFYQLDLEDVARKYRNLELPAPVLLDEDSRDVNRMRNAMLRSRIAQLEGRDGKQEEAIAFEVMRNAVIAVSDTSRINPRLSVAPDQIVWARSPARIDLAGGWSDTPPYSLLNGGSVVNVAVEINGQPPLQVFVKPCKDYKIVMRSIDLGASETLTAHEELLDFARVGSPFSIPKAALAIAGFAPGFSSHESESLETRLKEFGSGIEITLLSALPAGSGMGTSSILAATTLGALSDFCGLGLTSDEICERTLLLEQLLTTGGGWQDQYGGVLPGVKLLQTQPGLLQTPSVSWLPEAIFRDAEYAPCHVLCYTGLTRTAKGILAEIVKRMFLNDGSTLRLLEAMKRHSMDMAEAIQRRDFKRYGALVGETWRQNKKIDSGTCPEGVAAIIRQVEDLTLGLKLPGAGGGGYLYMVAKDPEAAAIIRSRLSTFGRCRLADMSVSATGLQISRS